jgi:hypothetical protein
MNIFQEKRENSFYVKCWPTWISKKIIKICFYFVLFVFFFFQIFGCGRGGRKYNQNIEKIKKNIDKYLARKRKK